MNYEIENVLRNMKPQQLQRAIGEAKRYIATPEGKKCMESIKNGTLPDGANMPDDLRKIAEALSKNPSAAKQLAAYLGL